MSGRFLRGALIAIIAGLALGVLVPGAQAEPRVVASIKPIHSLVAGVMEGIGTPALIVQGAGSPHTYSLRPSEARALNRADLVFWIGPVYESFLERPLSGLPAGVEIVRLMDAPGIRTLPAREGGAWEEDEHDHAHDHASGPIPDAEVDGHLYLDPENAKAIVRAIVAALSARDTANAGRYAANGERMLSRLDALDAELRDTLAPVRGKPFIVFHDAYQYLEQRYGLNAVGSVTVSPERLPGARRLHLLREKIAALKAVCVFAEPQFEPALVQTITEGTSAKIATLDPLGTALPPGPDAYAEILRGLGRSLVDCLGR